MAQGILPFQYEAEANSTGLTGRAGLGLYLELMAAMDLPGSISELLHLRPTQGWTDLQQVVSVLLLQLAGGEHVEDINRLEADDGLCTLIEQVEQWGLYPSDRGRQAKRWRRTKERTFPSPDALLGYLESFDLQTEQARQQAEGAFVPDVSESLEALRDLVSRTACWKPADEPAEETATLDIDATLIESHKRTAKPCYKGWLGFQPLNVFWWERSTMLLSEFRDGNCPACWRNLDVLKQGLSRLPDSVEQLRLRADTAGYDHRLLKYCADGHNERFGPIEFAVSVDVTASFRQAVQRVDQWQDLEYVDVDGQRWPTGQQWARLDYVPDWLGYTKRDLGIRFFAIRQPLSQPSLLDEDEQGELPFPTMVFEETGRSKLFGLVTNRTDLTGAEAIRWHRKRGGDSEQVHAELKGALAGGSPPSSDHFGANAAWWQLSLLAYNLHVLMQTQVIGPMGGDQQQAVGSQDPQIEDLPDQSSSEKTSRRRRRKKSPDSQPAEPVSANPSPTVSRLKTERFRWLNIPGRVIRHARRLIIRLPSDSTALELFEAACRRIRAMTRAPPTRWSHP